MATISKLVVSLSADSAKLEKALSRTRKSVASWGKAVAKSAAKMTAVFSGLTAILGGALLVAINKNAAAIDDMTKAAGKLNFPIEDFQKFSFIAEKSNISMDKFGTSLQRMQKSIGDARAGLSTANDALERLGVNVDDLANMNPSEQFELIAEKMKDIPLQADRVKVAMDIFGRSGADLLNVFAGDVKGIGDEFESLGVALTRSQSDAVAAFQDSKTTLSALFNGFSQKVTANISPAFTSIIESINDVIKQYGGLDKAAVKFAKIMIIVSSNVVKAFGFIIDAAEGAKIVLETAFKGVGTYIGEQLAAITNGDILIKTEFSDLPKIAEDFNKSAASMGAVGRQADALSKTLDGMVAGVGKEAQKANSHVELYNQNQKKLAEQALKTANSLKTVEDTAKTTAKVQQAANVSDQFKQYFDMAKRDLNSGSIFADSKIQVLNNLIEASKNNAALPETTRAMQDMVDSLNNVLVKPASQNNTQINQSQSLGSLTLNMITNVGEVTGQILGTPQFLQSVKTLVERQVNDVARTAVN